jgi:hypothetical protein
VTPALRRDLNARLVSDYCPRVEPGSVVASSCAQKMTSWTRETYYVIGRAWHEFVASAASLYLDRDLRPQMPNPNLVVEETAVVRESKVKTNSYAEVEVEVEEVLEGVDVVGSELEEGSSMT